MRKRFSKYNLSSINLRCLTRIQNQTIVFTLPYRPVGSISTNSGSDSSRSWSNDKSWDILVSDQWLNEKKPKSLNHWKNRFYKFSIQLNFNNTPKQYPMSIWGKTQNRKNFLQIRTKPKSKKKMILRMNE